MSTSRSERPRPPRQRAVALQYGVSDAAPVIVASGMGHLAEKILDVAQENGVPIYEDNSLATILSQLDLGQSIPGKVRRLCRRADELRHIPVDRHSRLLYWRRLMACPAVLDASGNWHGPSAAPTGRVPASA